MESLKNPIVEKYKSNIQESLNNIIFSYPFYNKSDKDIVNDAILRGQKRREFAFYIAGGINREEVPVTGEKQIASRTIMPLFDFIDNIKVDFIKLSSFIYPYNFVGDLALNNEEIASTINYSRINTYNKLFSFLNENIIGKPIFITTKLAGGGKYGVSFFYNIVTMDNKDEMANFVRKHFAIERKNFIKSMLRKPYLYFNSPVDQNDKKYCFDALKAFENKLNDELIKIKNITI
jgi:hypothetical protein